MIYEQALKTWGARKLGFTDDQWEKIEVEFRFDVRATGGCPTCGPTYYQNFEVYITGPEGTSHRENFEVDDYGDNTQFQDILAEIVAVAASGVSYQGVFFSVWTADGHCRDLQCKLHNHWSQG